MHQRGYTAYEASHMLSKSYIRRAHADRSYLFCLCSKLEFLRPSYLSLAGSLLRDRSGRFRRSARPGREHRRQIGELPLCGHSGGGGGDADQLARVPSRYPPPRSRQEWRRRHVRAWRHGTTHMGGHSPTSLPPHPAHGVSPVAIRLSESILSLWT